MVTRNTTERNNKDSKDDSNGIIVTTALALSFRKARTYVICVHLFEIRKSVFPERRKLLTEDEYRKEGIRETKKAITELKEYCASPECNPWKTILRLKDPIRLLYYTRI